MRHPGLAEIEGRRLKLQASLDTHKTPEERNVWGQFATPPELALSILRFVAKLLPPSVRFIDPGLGTGSFFSALRGVVPQERIEAATGIELDPLFADAARKLWKEEGLDVRTADFTREKPPQVKYNLVVSNPPYVRHHHLDGTDKERLKAEVANKLHLRISGLAGLYCYFLLLSDDWMEDGGIGVWLIPSEFMDVNYGEAVKRYLFERVELLRIHRFCPSDVQFSDALVSSAIVVFRKRRPLPRHAAEFSFGGPILSPARIDSIPLKALRETRKWTSLPVFPSIGEGREGSALKEFFAIKRGLATGSNEFFILNERQVEEMGIPAECRRPILPNPRNVPADIVEADESGYPLNCPRLSLIDSCLPEEEISRRFPAFFRYLQTGREKGISDAYLCSKRRPWYSQERRSPAPFLFTYMGRSRDGKKPFRVIWNRSQATAHNVFLLLYPVGRLKEAIEENSSLGREVFEILRGISAERLLGEGRVYGGGLHKLEPKELERVEVPELADLLDAIRPPRQMKLAVGL
jgi:hypothetical protein